MQGMQVAAGAAFRTSLCYRVRHDTDCIQRFSFVESSPSWDLRRTRSDFLAWPDAGLGDFRGFLCFYFSVRFEKFLRKSTPLKKAVFWESTAAKVKLMFTCFLTDFGISINLRQKTS